MHRALSNEYILSIPPNQRTGSPQSLLYRPCEAELPIFSLCLSFLTLFFIGNPAHTAPASTDCPAAPAAQPDVRGLLSQEHRAAPFEHAPRVSGMPELHHSLCGRGEKDYHFKLAHREVTILSPSVSQMSFMRTIHKTCKPNSPVFLGKYKQNTGAG